MPAASKSKHDSERAPPAANVQALLAQLCAVGGGAARAERLRADRGAGQGGGAAMARRAADRRGGAAAEGMEDDGPSRAAWKRRLDAGRPGGATATLAYGSRSRREKSESESLRGIFPTGASRCSGSWMSKSDRQFPSASMTRIILARALSSKCERGQLIL